MSYVQQDMVNELESFGVNHGFAALGTAVVIVGPDVPFTVYSTNYSAPNLEPMADAGFLKRRKLSGSFEIEIYAVK